MFSRKPASSSSRALHNKNCEYNDSNNGYAGIFGRAVTGLRVSGGHRYRVHIKGGSWKGEVTGNNENDLNIMDLLEILKEVL